MEALNTPFVVPLGAFAVAIVAVVAGIWSQAHAVRVKAEQRMAMLARGMSVAEIEQLLGSGQEEKKAPKDPLRSLGNARRAGIILVSTGVGILLFFFALTAIIGERAILLVLRLALFRWLSGSASLSTTTFRSASYRASGWRLMLSCRRVGVWGSESRTPPPGTSSCKVFIMGWLGLDLV